MSRSNNRVFLITGASSGIGEAVAKAAVEQGFRVVLAARREAALTQLAEELGGLEYALPVKCDVTSWRDQQSMAARAVEHFGSIDVILANAGIYISGGGFSKGEPEHWKDMILTNVYGVGLTIRAGLAALRASKGHLLLLGSAAGRRPISGSMYGATKWAVTGMGYNVREELRGSGIRVTILEPGVVETPLFDTPRPDGMRVDDVSGAIMYAVSQPPHVDVHEVLMYPTPPETPST